MLLSYFFLTFTIVVFESLPNSNVFCNRWWWISYFGSSSQRLQCMLDIQRVISKTTCSKRTWTSSPTQSLLLPHLPHHDQWHRWSFTQSFLPPHYGAILIPLSPGPLPTPCQAFSSPWCLWTLCTVSTIHSLCHQPAPGIAPDFCRLPPLSHPLLWMAPNLVLHENLASTSVLPPVHVQVHFQLSTWSLHLDT